MFWNVTFIYNAFIRTTDHCKVQTAFVSSFYIFINMKPWNASYSSVVVGRPRPLGHLTNFLRIFTNFFNFGKFVKIRDFFAEVTNSRSMVQINPKPQYLLIKFQLRLSKRYVNFVSKYRGFVLGLIWTATASFQPTNLFKYRLWNDVLKCRVKR